MKKINLVVLLLFLVFCLLVSCEKNSEDNSFQSSTDWLQYGIDNDGNTWLYNRNLNIKKDGDNYIVNAWAKRVLSDKGRDKIIQQMTNLGKSTEGYDKLSEDKIFNEVDCKNQRYMILSISRYNKDGKVLFSENVDKGKWNYVTPNSNGSIFLKKVCPEK